MPTTTANSVAPSIMAAVIIIAVEIWPAAAGCRAIDSTPRPPIRPLPPAAPPLGRPAPRPPPRGGAAGAARAAHPRRALARQKRCVLGGLGRFLRERHR